MPLNIENQNNPIYGGNKESWLDTRISISNIIHILILIFGLGMGWMSIQAKQGQMEEQLREHILIEKEYVRADVMGSWQQDVSRRLERIEKKIDGDK